MGVWALPVFRLMFDITGTAALCFFVLLAAFWIMPTYRWVGRAALGSFGFAVLAAISFLSTSYYYQNINPKPAFMAQCQLHRTQQTCLSSYRQFYPSGQ